MKLAKWIFLIAGIGGLLSTIPLVFTEKMMGVNQPEFYYGFVCLDICWQILYLFISSDPVRYRPIMIPAFLVKGSGTNALRWARTSFKSMDRYRCRRWGLRDLILRCVFGNTP
jgi:hypothetical protein